MNMKFNNGDFDGLGLNLLIMLSALVRERSVRATAVQLRVGSPAVSMALGRLRDVLGDPLFVRSKLGMVPTARALELVSLVDPFLAKLRASLLDGAMFDPQTAVRTVRVAIADDLEAVILPDLLAALRAEAPAVTLVVRDANYQAIDAIIASGDADIVVAAILHEHPVKAPHRVLYRDRFVALFDPARLGDHTPLSLESYSVIPQILISPRGETTGLIDRVLEGLGARRHVAATTTKFSTVPLALRGAGMLCNVPSVSAAVLAQAFGLATRPLPFASPEFNVGIAWQAALEHDPLTEWLMARIAAGFDEACKAVGTSDGSPAHAAKT